MLAKWRFHTLFFSLLLLAGCAASSHKAPLEERSGSHSRRVQVHTVARGDTLFSVARSHGFDAGELARANGLRAPYTIYPGQKLYVGTPAAVAAMRRGESYADENAAEGGAGGGAAAGKNSKSKSKTRLTKNAGEAMALGPWRWPADGALIQRFGGGEGGAKGIDIQGQLGEPVYAANSGKVVYAGSGLLGYGNLLIVRHNEQYLSAYAHNSRLLVREGEMIKAGDRIAEVGDSGTDSTRLHFEIRRYGEPVDPLGLLPRR